MALILNKDLDSGASATYHRIGRVSFDTKSKTMLIRVDAYLDQESRSDGKTAMESTEIIPDIADVITLLVSNNMLASIYDYLKGLDTYSGAADAMHISAVKADVK